MDPIHVLISRPEPECSELADELSDAGFRAIPMPAFGFAATAIEVDPQGAWRHADARLAVFTSPRSVEFGLAAVPADFFDEALLASVGPATTAMLQTAGMRVAAQPDSNFSSEGLLAHPALAAMAGQSRAALIFAAPGGRDALRQGLEDLGWSVQVAMVYRRVPQEPSAESVEALNNPGRVVSLWTSRHAMDQVLGCLDDDARASILSGEFIVASERLEEAARQRGAQRIVVAAGADNESLLEAVRGFG